MIVSIKRIGITGAGGNIGSTLCDGLKDSYELSLFDRKPLNRADFPSRVLDLSVQEELTGVFNNLDAIIHLAGNPSPNADEADTIKNNFHSTSFVFNEARRAGVKKVIFASSNFYHEGDIGLMMQGRRTQPIFLSTTPTPQSLYGKSKLFGEQLGLHLSHLGISFVALRIGWTVPQDSPLPYDSPYMRAMFCSKRDLVQAFHKALHCDTAFAVAYAISDNDDKMFDMTSSKTSIGYKPIDNSADYFTEQ